MAKTLRSHLAHDEVLGVLVLGELALACYYLTLPSVALLWSRMELTNLLPTFMPLRAPLLNKWEGRAQSSGVAVLEFSGRTCADLS